MEITFIVSTRCVFWAMGFWFILGKVQRKRGVGSFGFNSTYKHTNPIGWVPSSNQWIYRRLLDGDENEWQMRTCNKFKEIERIFMAEFGHEVIRRLVACRQSCMLFWLISRLSVIWRYELGLRGRIPEFNEEIKASREVCRHFVWGSH